MNTNIETNAEINKEEVFGRTSALSPSQLDHMNKWVRTYIATNEHVLRTKGVNPISIHDDYKVTTPFPVGRKAFAPMLHLYGLEKVRKGNGFIYVLMK